MWLCIKFLNEDRYLIDFVFGSFRFHCSVGRSRFSDIVFYVSCSSKIGRLFAIMITKLHVHKQKRQLTKTVFNNDKMVRFISSVYFIFVDLDIVKTNKSSNFLSIQFALIYCVFFLFILVCICLMAM